MALPERCSLYAGRLGCGSTRRYSSGDRAQHALFGARPHYARLDLRVEKNFSFSFGDANIYVDAVNILGRRKIAQRSYFDGNVANIASSGLVALLNDDEGVPRFVGVGIGFKF